MRMDQLRLGMKVHHAVHGAGIVRSINPMGAHIDFGEVRREISAVDKDLHPAEPVVNVSGLDSPLADYVAATTHTILRQLNIEPPGEEIVEDLAKRWHGGTMTLTPADSSLQSKEIPLETFFHKIVMMRNNLRVLEQKINAHPVLTDAEKVEMQQYITRCYGSMTTFNVLFKDKG